MYGIPPGGGVRYAGDEGASKREDKRLLSLCFSYLIVFRPVPSFYLLLNFPVVSFVCHDFCDHTAVRATRTNATLRPHSIQSTDSPFPQALRLDSLPPPLLNQAKRPTNNETRGEPAAVGCLDVRRVAADHQLDVC